VSASLTLEKRGKVLCAASGSSAQLLESAGSLAIGGLVLGSLSPELIQAAQQQAYPILVIEGYGTTRINDFSRRLLVSNAGRETAINAVKWNRWTGERPELIISLPESGDAYREIVELKLGQLVKVHSAPYCGQLATVDSIKEGMTSLPNHIRANAVGLKFLDNQRAAIPLPNFELIDLDNR
jgi:hypothetical protein